jgi:predicted ATPase
VFISSTLEELAPERTAAREAVEHLRLTPVLFELGARPHPPRDLYRAYLDQSHIFVGIYGRQYGWVAPDESISGLEDEYRLSGYRPRLIYIQRTPAPRERRLEELLDRIREDGLSSYREFSTPDELRELIENDLAVLLTERFEQLVRPGEPAPTNVPTPRNPLLGRDRELALACNLLRREDAHVVTLTGPGGCGKSRLGLQVALELLDHFEGGIFLVMLESISHPIQVVPAIAEALGVRETPGEPRFDSLCDYLRDSHTLLLLDNFEHVVSEAPTISMLLERCPQLAVLATSRTPLRVRGERELPIPPLETPRVFDEDLERLSQYAAVALFVQRARGAREGLVVTDENASAIAEICHRLDGLPLAIELAAARLKILSPEALLARLASRFEVLQGGARDLPERHRTLRGAIDWSHDLLDEAERRVFRRLGVFAGGSTLEAAEAVCAEEGDPETATLDVIASLLDSSMLITSAAGGGGEIRIGMLETIRAYAVERLLESGETQWIRRNHAEYYCALCEEARPHLVGPDEPRWASRLQAERDNLRLALGWSVENDVELGLRLARALFRFWEAHNMIVEGHRWLTTLLARSSPPSHTRGAVLHAAAAFESYLGDYDAARRHVREALDIFEGIGDERGVATALNELGVLASYESDFAEARRLLEESLAIKRTLGDDWLIANAFVNLGNVAGWGGDHALGYELHVESLALFEKTGERMGVAIANHNLAGAALRLGRLAEALERHVASLQVFDEIGDRDGCAESVEGLAMLAVAHDDHARAARLFGLATLLREDAGTQSPAPQRAEVDRNCDAARRRLGEVEYEAAWQAGRGLSVGEAIALAGALAPVGDGP